MHKPRAVALLFTVLLTMMPSGLNTQDRTQGRSMTISRHGIVAAESPLAAQAGIAMLESGGNAIDAAVAANAMMGLIAPMSNGIGGDLFAIVFDAKSGKYYGLNASGWAPAGLSVEHLRGKGHRRMPQLGIHSVTVPGAVDGWNALLTRFGRKKLADVLAPSIRVAEEDFPVTEWVSQVWTRAVTQAGPGGSIPLTYLVNGRAPRVGEIFRNPDLAWSYRQIAANGRDAFYKGEIARRILDFSAREGGTMTAADMAEFSSEWVDPISTTYRGWTVLEMPPNGQGIAALEMLNILENFPLAEYGHNSARALHTMIEAKKLAYADLLRHIGEPRASRLPVSGLLSKDYARTRAKLIDPARANCAVEAGTPPAVGNDTIYLSVVDREGNMVSLIQSNYLSVTFGSGLVAPGTGFALHNRGGLFSLDTASPNALAGRKRPLHTIIPAFLEKGDVRIAFGIMGGWNQSQAHVQFVANVVDFGMNVQQALDAARFTKSTFAGCDVEMESRIAENVRSELAARGHKIERLGTFSSDVGGGQAVQRDFPARVNYGASDPRKDGAALPQLPREN